MSREFLKILNKLMIYLRIFQANFKKYEVLRHLSKLSTSLMNNTHFFVLSKVYYMNSRYHFKQISFLLIYCQRHPCKTKRDKTIDSSQIIYWITEPSIFATSYVLSEMIRHLSTYGWKIRHIGLLRVNGQSVWRARFLTDLVKCRNLRAQIDLGRFSRIFSL